MIYDGILKSGMISTELLASLQSTFLQSLFQGYGQRSEFVDYDTPDYYSLRFLKNNLAAFSAAKDMTQLREFSKLLLDESGNRRSFSEFRNLVSQASADFNQRWLQTEYDTAFANAQMARSWNDIQSNTTFTSITIRTAGDERVRDSHSRYEGFTRPKNDPIWNSFWPPFDWNCRCIAEEGSVPNEGAIDLKEIPVLFRNNPGVSGVAFDNSHPYFDRFKKGASAIAYPTGAVIDQITYKDYLLKPLKASSDLASTRALTISFNDWWRVFMQGRKFGAQEAAIVISSYGDKLKLTREIASESTYPHYIIDVMRSFDEQWLRSKSRHRYFKRYLNGVLVVEVSKNGEITSIKLVDYAKANELRNGILITV